MTSRIIGIKLMVMLSILSGVAVAPSSGGQTRTKKQNMAEMGEQFTALDRKMMAGAVTSKFSDQDFQEIEAACSNLIRLANEYTGMESDQNLTSISTALATSINYLKQQLAGKDPVVVVTTSGRLLSFCAECHYQTRWKASPTKP
jgi:gas vesicle protein